MSDDKRLVRETQPTARRYDKGGYDTSWKIRLLVKGNPKRGKSRARFEYYDDGMTVGAYLRICRANGIERALTLSDLRWDVAHHLISIKP